MIQALEVDRFSISALAGIVGVPVETLRTWERRYGVPESQREAMPAGPAAATRTACTRAWPTPRGPS